MRFLPYGRQTIDDDDIAAVAAALQSEYLTTGPAVAEFERAFAEATGAVCAVACNSGTAALHLAALTLDLVPGGDAVIVPSLTFLATANVVRMCGAEVVFADVDPDTGLMAPENLLEALSRVPAGLRAKAAIPVHLNGQICDTASLASVASEAGIQLVEDACHALGADRAGANAHSVMACFSTHPVKAIATGEGGVVTTRDGALASRLAQLRSHGMMRDPAEFASKEFAFDGDVPNPWYYEMAEYGWNYRLPDILCALGTSQLKKLPAFHARRREIAAIYDRLLTPLAPVVRPVPHGAAAHGWHLYAILMDFAALNTTRRSVMETLRAQDIGTQVHYLPVHHQPYYRKRYGELTLSGADAYYARCLSIPLFPSMSDQDVERVVEGLLGVCS
ncbi:MAG: UDP-4-amino-4,6-dideoxy-N-acetyl-beta-L-altrosamine transaminase [Bacteroidales bacterium]|nr:UDP-4-amino-4,6-dideoxy-N-acetyl-beta-L-altrosamine transaminase [Bacteroidales bacterium]